MTTTPIPPSPQLEALLAALESAPSELRRADATVEEMRVRREDGERPAALAPAVAGTSYEPVDIDGLAGELVTAPGAGSGRVILHLHGGGFVLGGLDTHRSFVSHLSDATGATVLHVDYRLAPEHPYPAALDDCQAAYRWVRSNFPGAPVLSGDSAGGGLAMSVLLRARASGDPLPVAAVLVSPWVDLTLQAPAIAARAELDPLIGPANLRTMVAAYLDGHDPADPLVSPRFGDLAGLPPMLVLVGGREILHDDAVGLADAARSQGVDVTLQVHDELFHVFPLFAGVLPEADRAVRDIAARLEGCWT